MWRDQLTSSTRYVRREDGIEELEELEDAGEYDMAEVEGRDAGAGFTFVFMVNWNVAARVAVCDKAPEKCMVWRATAGEDILGNAN
jgi:hypothetical protein